MEQVFIDNQTYDKADFKANPLKKGEYESCTFKNCNLSEADLSGMRFIDCNFLNCNLSLAKLSKTALQDIKFKDCKMLGLRFEHCDKFNLSVGFENCQLNHSTFYQLKLKKTIFRNTQLQECDFTEADLTAAIFDECDLAKSTFENTNLEQADLRSADNYSIDPELNRVKKARFSVQGLPGLLGKYDISIE